MRKYATSQSPREGWGGTRTFPNFSYADWHTYAIEWDRNRIIWYLDGKPVSSLSGHGIVYPVRIILNLALENEPASAFETHMYVDYVKVYQLKCSIGSLITVINEIPNFNTYTYEVKKSISLSGATTIPAGSNISLRANDFIELKPGFEVPVGRELFLDVSPCECNWTLIPHIPW